MKNTLDDMNIRTDTAKEKMNTLQRMAIEVVQETQKHRNQNLKQQNLKQLNLQIARVLKGEDLKKKTFF